MSSPVGESDLRAVAGRRGPSELRLGGLAWIAWVCVATLVFVKPLIALFAHAATSELLSYVPLVPIVALFLLYVRRGSLVVARQSSVGWAVALGLVSAAAAVASIVLADRVSANDRLVLTTLAYVAMVLGGGFLCLGARWMAAATFPVSFLLFLIPPPDAVVRVLEAASVLGSAEVSAWLFRLTGTPLVREGTVFIMPGIALEIARECSGINSSWVLFIVSLVASNLFLTRTWSRVVLIAVVVPLAIIRNSVRILTIGLLCVHVGPHMVNSYIHRSGGPVFFALSLVPLFLVLLWLRRAER